MSTKHEPDSPIAEQQNSVGSVRRVARRIAIAPIRFYQVAISPFRAPSCRFYPSCSAYALTAVSRHGVFKGTYLAVRRLLRCHPWNAGGVDHVPN